MPDRNYTALLLVIDRSGSMVPIAEVMTESIAALLAEQAAMPGLTTVDIIQFDHQSERIYQLADPSEVEFVLEARGGTALYDAIGSAVFDFTSYIRSLPEHATPATVQCVIVSDGADTRSTEYTARTVRALVQAREADGWQFTFLGAGIDAEEAAEDLGTTRVNGVTFERDAQSVRLAMARTSRRIAESRRPSKS